MLSRILPLLISSCFALSAIAQVSLSFEVTEEKNGKPSGDDLVMTFASNPEGTTVMHTQLEEGSTRILFYTDGSMLTLTPGDSGSMVGMKLKVPKIGRRDVAAYKGEVTRTDQTKEILGYTARKFIMTSPKGEVTESWLAEVPGFSYEKLFGSLSGKGPKAMSPPVPEMPDAVSLESHTTSKNGKRITHVYVQEVAVGGDVDAALFEVPADATVTDMTSLSSMFGN